MISTPELATIYEDLRPTLVRYVLSLGQSEQIAEDIVQDAMIRFWRRYKRGKKPLNLAVEICKNLTFNSIRDSRFRNNLLVREFKPICHAAPDEIMEINEAHAEVRRVMLLNLKGTTYMVVRLYLDGYSPADISEQTGLPVGRVYHELRRAK